MEKQYYKYRLRGVVIHTGTAEYGHYYSLINQKDDNAAASGPNNNWYEFNDHRVTPFPLADLPNEAFGGQDRDSEYEMGGGKGRTMEKSKNAYLLFYERDKYYNQKDEPMENMVERDKESLN